MEQGLKTWNTNSQDIADDLRMLQNTKHCHTVMLDKDCSIRVLHMSAFVTLPVMMLGLLFLSGATSHINSWLFPLL